MTGDADDSTLGGSGVLAELSPLGGAGSEYVIARKSIEEFRVSSPSLAARHDTTRHDINIAREREDADHQGGELAK